MRFGRKLALQAGSDDSGAPYLSHKQMKEAINLTVRELRVYQAAHQTAQSWKLGFPLPGSGEAPAPEDIAAFEERIRILDAQLFEIVEEDLVKIFEHVRVSEEQLQQGFAELQNSAIAAGMLIEETQMERMKKLLPGLSIEPETLCQQFIDMHLRSEPALMASRLSDIGGKFNAFVSVVNEHTRYLEINVAGFRKLLKRHEKQIPQQYHSRPTQYLGFHKLVTKTTRQLTESVKMFAGILNEVRERLQSLCENGGKVGSGIPPDTADQVLRICQQLPDLEETKGLGLECEMVLAIQRQLNDPSRGGLHIDASAPAGFLYPKPGALP